MNGATSTTIRDIVVQDFRTAAVFQKHRLDFCCRGDVPLQTACEKRKIDLGEVLSELDQVLRTPVVGEPYANTWDLDFLADYIVQNHHRFVRRTAPALRKHTMKISRVHGKRRPELVEVMSIVDDLINELEPHMNREEHILFPYIKAMARGRRENQPIGAGPFKSVATAIRMMEQDHQDSGELLDRLVELTDNYQPPADACMTYRVTFQQLAEFDADLRRHIHLENNILFPKAIALEEEAGESEEAEADTCSVVPGV